MQSKSSPVSIRFDTIKLEHALIKSGMSSKQRLVDYLIDRYVGNDQLPSLPLASAEPTPPKPAFQITKSFDYYSKARQACESAEEWQILRDEILSSSLSTKQKALLTN